MKFLEKFFGRSGNDSLEDELRHWRIITVENEEENFLMIFRVRLERPELANIDEHETAISISWPYESEGPVPTEETAAEMTEFEILVEELTDDNGFSYLVQVTTGMGERQWLFYTSDQERFMKTFNELLADTEWLPINIEFMRDPHWEVWRDTIDTIKEKQPEAFSES